MSIKIERYKNLISRTQPSLLESFVRGVLIHYFFHISDKSILEIVRLVPDEPLVVNLLTPTVFKGKGLVKISSTVVFGVIQSPRNYECSYIEARTNDALIEIGEGCMINNAAILISEGAGIHLGARCLLGVNVQIMDTNFHELDIEKRNLADANPVPVVIEEDVFIGSSVIILKGCKIGKGCVIAAGSLLRPGFIAPPNSIIGGNPARVVGSV